MPSWLSMLKGKTQKLDNLEDLFFMQLKELRNMEEQIIDALPEMADAAYSPQLKQAFMQHLDETRMQKNRLDDIFTMCQLEPESMHCEGVEGIIDDGKVIIEAKGDPNVKDAALIAAAQRIEHYEMAGYGTCRTFAQYLGWSDIADILQRTLDEEKNSDKMLSDIAVSSINPKAA